MKAKKGFTLAELLVALACSSIVLLGIMSSFGVVMTLQKRAINTSEATHHLPVLREYICENNITTDDRFIIRYGTIAYAGEVIAKGTNVTSITFTPPEQNDLPYTLCRITENDRCYEFFVINTP